MKTPFKAWLARGTMVLRRQRYRLPLGAGQNAHSSVEKNVGQGPHTCGIYISPQSGRERNTAS